MPRAAPDKPLVITPGLPDRLHTCIDLERLTQKGLHFELSQGVLHEMTPPGDDHGFTTVDLITYLNFYILSNRLGQSATSETGFLLARNPDTVLAPDFAFIAGGKLSGANPQGYVPVVPNLILETRSPSDTEKSAEAKIVQWLGFGVPVCLEMNPPKRVLRVYRTQPAPKEGESLVPDAVLGANDTLTLPDLLPGFSLDLGLVFRNVGP